MKKLFALGSIALAFAGVKADIQVEWSASAGSSALPDVVSVTYEGDAVKTLTVSPQNSESVVFAGAAISFASDAVISLTANGSIVFSNKVVSASGALSVSRGGALLSWEGEALPVTANPAEGRVIFTGVSIDDLSVASSDFGNAESGLTGFARPYFVSRSEGILECQLQSQKTAEYNAGTTQSAKLVLMQDGENIRASIAWAKTNGTTYGDYRGKLDFTEPVTVNQETLAEIDSPVVNNLTMVYMAAKQMGQVIFAGETEVESFKVEGGVQAVLDAESTQGDIASHVNVSADSMFVFKNAYGRTVTGALSGNGDVLFENDAAYSYFRPGFIYSAGDIETEAKSKFVLFKANACLSTMTGISAVIGCGSKGVLPIAKDGYVLTSKTSTCQDWQIQGLDTTVGKNFMRCANLRFMQDGDDILVKYVSARQGSGEQGVYLQGSHQNMTASNSGNSAAIYWYDLKAFFSEPIELPSTVLSVQNNMVAGDFIVGANAQVSFTAKEALPSFGRVQVLSGAVASLDFGLSQDSTTFYPHISSFCVDRGGKLRQTKKFAIGYMMFVWNEGGMVEVDTPEAGFDTQLNHLMLSDGAEVMAQYIRCGGRHMGRWEVSGSEPSSVTLKKDLTLYGPQDSTEQNPLSGNFQLSVDDVTGNAADDFVFEGKICTPQNSAHTNITFIKSGAGTCLLKGKFDVKGGLDIFGGYMRLGISNAMPDSQSVTMRGGGLSLAANTENTVGVLSIAYAGGSIELNEGSKLTVGSIGFWQIGQIDGRLKIEGPYEPNRQQLVFPMLTAQQRKVITWNGERIMQKADGTLALRPRNLRIIIR